MGLKSRYETPVNDSKKIGLGYSDAEDIISMPVILMHPQYRQSDLIEQCLETDTLNKWLFRLFPKGQPPLPWDTERVLVNANLADMSLFCKSNDFEQNTLKQRWIKVDPSMQLGEIIASDPEYVVPKWPVFFVVHKSYLERFLALDITKVY